MLSLDSLHALAAVATDRTRRARVAAALGAPAEQRHAQLEALLAQWRAEGRVPEGVAGPWQARVQLQPVLGIHDPAYPLLLAATPDPPPLVFYLGELGLLGRPCVAVVGSRKALPGSLAVAADIAGGLARAGVVVVSGLARGVDGAAHVAALDAGGTTIAVLGGGLDRVYPRDHHALHRRIASGGLLLSEHPAGVAPLPAYFPMRNRIISGLSRAVVVVEAAERSGSLGTAREALEQGREVLVVPGAVPGGRFAGSHRLLRDGAALVECAQDVLALLGIDAADAPTPPVEAPIARATTRTVLEACSNEALDVDALGQRTGLDVAQLRVQLMQLELAGFVASTPHGYIRTR